MSESDPEVITVCSSFLGRAIYFSEQVTAHSRFLCYLCNCSKGVDPL